MQRKVKLNRTYPYFLLVVVAILALAGYALYLYAVIQRVRRKNAEKPQ